MFKRDSMTKRGVNSRHRELEESLERVVKQRKYLLNLLVLMTIFLFLVLITQSGEILQREITFSERTVSMGEGLTQNVFNQQTNLSLSLTSLPHSISLSGSVHGSAKIFALSQGNKYLVFDSDKYSDSSSLGNITFTNACDETCNLSLSDKNITLQIFVDGELKLNSIKYIAGDVDNTPPYWKGRNIFVVDNVNDFSINLNEYVNDLEMDQLSFSIPLDSQKHFFISGDDNSKLTLVPSEDLRGNIKLDIHINDGIDSVSKELNFFIIGDINVSKNESVFIDPKIVDELYKKDRAKVIIEISTENTFLLDVHNSSVSNSSLSSGTNINGIGGSITSITSFVEAHHESPDIVIRDTYDTNNLVSAEISSKGLEELKENPDVKAVYIDPILTLDLTESVGLINGIVKSSSDTDGKEIILTGRNTSVCIIDTGVDDHKAFGDRIVDQQCFCEVSDLGSGGCCSNSQNRDSSAKDDSLVSHGTKVAGIVGADGDVRGVAPETNIIAVKSCDFLGRCLGSDILAGIDYCISKREEYNIVSLVGAFSDGEKYSNSEECPSLFDTSLNLSLNNRIIPVFSSGNEYYRNGIGFPACSPYALSVGAIGKDGYIQEYSNLGNLLDILAPGESITSTARNNRYSSSSGTSMAAPHVAGAIALIMQDFSVTNTNLSVVSINTIIDSLIEAGEIVQGYPLIDVGNTLSLLHGGNLSGYVRPRNLEESNIVASEFGGLDKFVTNVDGMDVETYTIDGESFSLIKRNVENETLENEIVHLDVSTINLGDKKINLLNSYENGIFSQDVIIESDEVLVELEGDSIIEYKQKEKSVSEQKVQAYTKDLESKRVLVKDKLNTLGVKTKNELDDVFNGIVVEVDKKDKENKEKQIEQIKSINGVKRIHYPVIVKADLRESLDIINASYAWNTKSGVDGVNITGRGVKIAIIDTGVDYTHPDLGGCFGSGCKVVKGYDYINNDNNPMDDHGHGTHVAATAAGNGDLSSGGLKGVAPDAQIYAYKVLSSAGSGSSLGIITAIEAAVDDGADVISMSLGGNGEPDSPMGVASNNAMKSGVVVVVAAGNSGPGKETIGSPGNAHDIITVGATDKSDKIASFSSRGPTSTSMIKPEIIAPGVNICAAQWDSWLSSRLCSPNLDKHIAISGTSMATPHVAGAVALLKQSNSNLTTQQIKSMLVTSSDDLGYDVNTQGGGRLNIKSAIESEISFSPSVLNFGSVKTSSPQINVNITNFGNKNLSIKLLSSSLNDGSKDISDVVTFSPNEFIISPRERKSVVVTLNTNNILGDFGGLVKVEAVESTNNISTLRKSYNLPLYFSKGYDLTLNYKLKNNNLFNPGVAVVHDAYVDFYDSHYPSSFRSTFKVNKNGTIYYHIIGIGGDTHAIISGSVEVQGDTNVTIVGDSYTNYTVPARDFDGDPLDLSALYYSMTIKGKNRTLQMSKGYLSNFFHGDQNIILSDNFEDNSNFPFKKEVEFYFIGIPETYHKSLWKGVDTSARWNWNRYANAPEMYFVGNKVNNSKSISFAYNKSQFGEYIYNYNLHTNQSKYFHDVTFWNSPNTVFALAPFMRIGAPLSKMRYIQNNGYGQWSMTKISYTSTNDSNLDTAFGNARAEDYEPYLSWPRGIRAKSGEKIKMNMGGLYSFPSFNNVANYVRLRDKILMDQNQVSYITRPSSVGVNSKIYPLEKPRVIIINADTNSVLSNREIYGWSSYSQYTTAKNLRTKVYIDPSYPILNTTIDAWFGNGQNPPYLSYLSAPTWFESGGNYDIEFNVSSSNLLRRVYLEYQDSQGLWKSVSRSNTLSSGEYKYSINTSSQEVSDLDKMNIRIGAEVSDTNKIIYTITPVANKAVNVTFGLKSSSTSPTVGSKVTLSGKCISKVGNINVTCTGLSFKIYYNNVLMFNEISDLDYADWSRSFNYTTPGIVNLVFEGTGYYSPVTETLTIGKIVDLTPPNISQIQKVPPIVYNDNDVLLSANVTDKVKIGTVLVKHNASGIWQTYPSILSDGSNGVSNGVYSYTIPSNLLSNQEVVSWQFIANDSSGNNANSSVFSFKVENRVLIAQKVPLINITEEQTAQIYVNVSDPDGDLVRIVYPFPFNNTGAWTTTRGDAGNYSFLVVASDKIDAITVPVSVYVNALPLLITKNDTLLNQTKSNQTGQNKTSKNDTIITPPLEPIPKYKRIIGDFDYSKYENFRKLNYLIGDSRNLSEIFEGKKRIKFDDDGKDILEFFHEFKEGRELNISKIELIKQRSTENRGSLIVKGISLPVSSNETKTIYLDRVSTSLNTICIKDAEIDNLSQISSKCNGANEYILDCSSSSLQQNLQYGNYTCTNLGTKYKVTGLRHSGALELCVDDDNDGSCLPLDCNDNLGSIYPNAMETCGDGIDQDCNGSDLSCPATPPSNDSSPGTPGSGSGGSGGGGGGGGGSSSKKKLSTTSTTISGEDSKEDIGEDKSESSSGSSSDEENELSGYDQRLLQKTQELCDELDLYNEDPTSYKLKNECEDEIESLTNKGVNLNINNKMFLIILVFIVIVSLVIYHFRFNLHLSHNKRKVRNK